MTLRHNRRQTHPAWARRAWVRGTQGTTGTGYATAESVPAPGRSVHILNTPADMAMIGVCGGGKHSFVVVRRNGKPVLVCARCPKEQR